MILFYYGDIKGDHNKCVLFANFLIKNIKSVVSAIKLNLKNDFFFFFIAKTSNL